MASERLGIGRRCPRCGTFSDTLSRACPVCGKRRRVPPSALLAGIPIALVVWVWLLTTDPVVGVALVGIAFIALVACIGLVNAFAERR